MAIIYFEEQLKVMWLILKEMWTIPLIYEMTEVERHKLSKVQGLQELKNSCE